MYVNISKETPPQTAFQRKAAHELIGERHILVHNAAEIITVVEFVSSIPPFVACLASRGSPKATPLLASGRRCHTNNLEAVGGAVKDSVRRSRCHCPNLMSCGSSVAGVDHRLDTIMKFKFLHPICMKTLMRQAIRVGVLQQPTKVASPTGPTTTWF
jgi:hypothetical protein